MFTVSRRGIAGAERFRKIMARPFHGGGSARYAIYWAPPEGSALAMLGAAWLGRDTVTDRPVKQCPINGFDDNAVAAITAEPRRYGLHATLKPPFALMKDRGLPQFEAALSAFAARTAPVIAPELCVSCLGQFLALTPARPASAIDALANSCVEHFDCYRAPPSQQELARRRSADLSAAQERNLQRWGYPYVMDEFRFHVSLTGAIGRAVTDRLEPELARLFAPVASQPLELRDIALFVEPAPGAPFQLLRRFALAG
jgi:putative phosphonate metabolism protein